MQPQRKPRTQPFGNVLRQPVKKLGGIKADDFRVL
jgi:hypothetical protein